MAPRTFAPLKHCGRLNCTGTCPIGAVQAGYTKGSLAKCRVCGRNYNRPNQHEQELQRVYLEGRNRNRGSGQKPAASQAAAAVARPGREKQLENQVAQLKAQLAKNKADNAAQSAVLDETDDTEAAAKADLDKKLADITAAIQQHKRLWGDDCQDELASSYLAKMEATADDIRTRKRLAKPIGSRTLQATRQLEAAKKAKATLTAARATKQQEYEAFIAKSDKELADTDAKIVQLQKEVDDILRETAAHPAAEDDPVATIRNMQGAFASKLPSSLAGTTEGSNFLTDLQQTFDRLASAYGGLLEKEKAAKQRADEEARQQQAQQEQQQQQQQQQAQTAAGAVLAAVGPGAGRMSTAEDPMEIDQDDIDNQVDKIIPYDADIETQDAWVARKRAFRANLEQGKCKKYRLKAKA